MSKTQTIFLKPTVLAAVRLVGPYSETVPKAWTTIYDWLDQGHLHEIPGQGYGLTYDDPRTVPKNKLRYAAGVVAPINWKPCDSEPVSELLFDGGSYARRQHTGPYSEIGKIISVFRDQWIPENRLVFDPSQPILTLYRNDPREIKPEDQLADICLPVFADRREKARS